MGENDWNFILRWAPTLGAMLVLAVFALILQALERRSKHDGDSGTAQK